MDARTDVLQIIRERRFAGMSIREERILRLSLKGRNVFRLYVEGSVVQGIRPKSVRLLYALAEMPGKVLPYGELFKELNIKATPEQAALHNILTLSGCLREVMCDLGVNAEIAIVRKAGMVLCSYDRRKTQREDRRTP